MISSKIYRALSSIILITAVSYCSTIASAKKTTINFVHWYNFNKTAVDYMNKAVSTYEKAHPNVIIKQMPTTFGTTYTDKVLTMSAAGLTPDIIMVSGIFLTTLSGVLTELDPLLASSNFDNTITYKSMWRSATVKGKIFGVPFGGGVQGANFYNIDLMLKSGVNPKQPPVTWDDFLEIAKKMTKDINGDGKVEVFGADDRVINFPMMHVGAGGDLTTSNGLAVDWNTPAGIRALEFTYNMWRNKVYGSGFVQQKTGMWCVGPWEMGNIQSTAKFKWGLTRFPTPTENKIRLYSSADSLAIGKVPTERKKIAWDFIKYMLSPDMQAMLSIATGFPVMNSKAINTPIYTKALEQTPLLMQANDMMKYAFAPFPTPKDGDIATIYGRWIQKVATGVMEPKMAAAGMQKEAEALLVRYQKKK